MSQIPLGVALKYLTSNRFADRLWVARLRSPVTRSVGAVLIVAGLMGLIVSPSANAADGPLLIGVGTHLGQAKTGPRDLTRWMSESGIRAIRDEFYWGHLEKQKNSFTWTGKPLQAKLALGAIEAEVGDVALLTVLGYGNPLYGGGHPEQPEAVGAYTRYVSWLLGQLPQKRRYFEIWNEWNTGGGLAKPKRRGRAETYVALARQTYAKIKRLRPDATVLVGALGHDGQNWPWLQEAIRFGMLEAGDALSVHLYNHCEPQRVGADDLIGRLDKLRAILIDAGRENMGVYVTEVGWPTYEGRCGVGERTAAEYTLKFLLEASAREWVKGVWLYEFMDTPRRDDSIQAHFGLLRTTGEEKPSSCAVRAFNQVISDRPIRVLTRKGLSAYLFKKRSGGHLIFLFGNEQAARSSVRVMNAGAAELVDPCRLASSARVARVAGHVEVNFEGGMPVVLNLPDHLRPEDISLDFD